MEFFLGWYYRCCSKDGTDHTYIIYLVLPQRHGMIYKCGSLRVHLLRREREVLKSQISTSVWTFVLNSFNSVTILYVLFVSPSWLIGTDSPTHFKVSSTLVGLLYRTEKTPYNSLTHFDYIFWNRNLQSFLTTVLFNSSLVLRRTHTTIIQY